MPENQSITDYEAASESVPANELQKLQRRQQYLKAKEQRKQQRLAEKESMRQAKLDARNERDQSLWLALKRGNELSAED